MRLLPALLLACLFAAPALGETPAKAGPGPGDVLARLGTPATPDAVDAILALLPEAEEDFADAFADALGHAGGCAAARGLESVLRHRAPAVRVTALEAVERVGLRRESLVDEVRRMIREDRSACRLQAIRTLGHVGDGRDVELLLGLTKAEDARVRRQAFRALADLTGAAIPYVHARWTYYWRTYRIRASLLLPQALLVIEMEADAPDVETLCALVRRYGWVDLPTVRDQLSRWILEPDDHLRRVACELIADLRLSDLAPEVESTFRFAGRDGVREAARTTLDVLGVPVQEPESENED